MCAPSLQYMGTVLGNVITPALGCVISSAQSMFAAMHMLRPSRQSEYINTKLPMQRPDVLAVAAKEVSISCCVRWDS